MAKRAFLAGLLTLGASIVLVGASASAQDEQAINSTVGTFAVDVEGSEVVSLTASVTVEESPEDLADDNYAIGLFRPLSPEASVFVGLETFNGQSWASLVVDYASIFDQDDGSATPADGGSTFVDQTDDETRVAVPFDWENGEPYTVSITRQNVAEGIQYTATLTPTDGPQVAIGSQIVPASVVGPVALIHSVVQQTDNTTDCGTAQYLRASISQVTAETANGEVAAELLRGTVETGSCDGSGVFLQNLQQTGIIHELSGADSFLSGPLGTGLPLAGDFISGDSVNPDYPYCLANIDEESTRRVCFANDQVREDNIDLIVDDIGNRPPGETIWIGRFDEEVVAP